MSLEERVAKTEEQIKTLFDTAKKTYDSIANLETRLLGRPSWSVSVIITVLSSVCVGLIVALLR